MTSKSVVSTLWRVNTSLSPSPKSPPTTPTTRTSVKKLAAIEKCDAEPPSIRSRLPNGVSTASNATEPTTNSDMFSDLRFWSFDFGFLNSAELFHKHRKHLFLLIEQSTV